MTASSKTYDVTLIDRRRVTIEADDAHAALRRAADVYKVSAVTAELRPERLNPHAGTACPCGRPGCRPAPARY